MVAGSWSGAQIEHLSEQVLIQFVQQEVTVNLTTLGMTVVD